MRKPSLRNFKIVVGDNKAFTRLRVLIEEWSAGDTFFELVGELYHKLYPNSTGALFEFRYRIHPTSGMSFESRLKAVGHPDHLYASLGVPGWGTMGDTLVFVRHGSESDDACRKGSPANPRLLQALAVFHHDLLCKGHPALPELEMEQIYGWIVAVIRRRNCDTYRAHQAIAELVS